MARKNTKVLKEKEDKKAKLSTKKEAEIKEELRDEVKEEVKEEIVEDVREEILDGGSVMPKRNVSFWSEIKSLFIILLIIGLFVLGGWAWYSHMKDHPEGRKRETNKEVVGYEYKVINKEENKSYQSDEGLLIYDNKDGNLAKIIDSKGNVLFEGDTEYSYVVRGTDDKIYVVNDELAENENVLSVGIVKEGKIEQAFKVGKENVYFSMMLYAKDENSSPRLVGFTGSLTNNEDGEYKVEKTYIVNLNNETSELEGYVLQGDSAVNSQDSPITTLSDTYVTFSNYNGTEYGLYNYKNNSVAIEAKYDKLYSTYNNSFIAVKDNKAGIINANEKILTVFEYDFIDRHKDFYVVGKDDKLAIMSKTYEFITGFEFDYQRAYKDHNYEYTPCCATFNSFEAYKYGDKYLLVTNFGNDPLRGLAYPVNEAYIIYSNGKYETIAEDAIDYLDEGVLIFNSNDRTYTYYDMDLEEKTTIDMSSYAYAKEAQNFYMFGNIVGVYDKNVFFNLDTGKEIEDDKIVYENKNFKVEYDKKNITVYVDGESIYEFKASTDILENCITKTNSGFMINGPAGEKDILLIEK